MADARKHVKITRHYRHYVPGDDGLFSPNEAQLIVDRGYGSYVQQGDLQGNERTRPAQDVQTGVDGQKEPGLRAADDDRGVVSDKGGQVGTTDKGLDVDKKNEESSDEQNQKASTHGTNDENVDLNKKPTRTNYKNRQAKSE